MANLQKNELAALGLVNRQPMHGYRLNQAIQNIGLEHWTTLSRSSIYAALRRLAKRGAVSKTREREGQMPTRTVYHITSAGRDLLLDILRGALSYVGPEDRYFYLGLAFADALPEEEIASLLKQRFKQLRDSLEREKQAVEERRRSKPALRHLIMMSEAGMRHAEIELEFCRNIIELIDSTPDYFTRDRGVTHG
jgi:DNA-binding PadR family transcriptional regulator